MSIRTGLPNAASKAFYLTPRGKALASARAERARRPLAERFEEKVYPEPNSGCYLWTGSMRRGGYGAIKVGKKDISAAHAALILAGRPQPTPKHEPCHKCDNPGCAHEGHLFWGIHKENMEDMARKGRAWRGGGSAPHSYCKRGHPLSGSNLVVRSDGAKGCAICRKRWMDEYTVRRREAVRQLKAGTNG